MGTKHLKHDNVRTVKKERVAPVPCTRLRTELRGYLNSFNPKQGDQFEAHREEDDTRSSKAWVDAVRRACLAEGWLAYVRHYPQKAVVTLTCRV